MDDSTDDIKRDELLKLCGTGALTAVAALLAGTGAAEAAEAYGRPSPKAKPTRFTGNPIGLDLTFTAPGNKKPSKAALTTPTPPTIAKTILVTGDIDETVGASIVYSVTDASMKGYLPNGKPRPKAPLGGTVYVAIWI